MPPISEIVSVGYQACHGDEIDNYSPSKAAVLKGTGLPQSYPEIPHNAKSGIHQGTSTDMETRVEETRSRSRAAGNCSLPESLRAGAVSASDSSHSWFCQCHHLFNLDYLAIPPLSGKPGLTLQQVTYRSTNDWVLVMQLWPIVPIRKLSLNFQALQEGRPFKKTTSHLLHIPRLDPSGPGLACCRLMQAPMLLPHVNPVLHSRSLNIRLSMHIYVLL